MAQELLSDRRADATTRLLLTSGVAAAPLFILLVVVQDYTRDGFNPRDHPLSLLGTGDWGWIQITNFVLTGLLDLAFAAGLRRALRRERGGTWGPLLIGGHGLGLLIAGVFLTDPASGFPPGIPEPADPTLHHMLHGIGALLAFGSVIGACAVFTRRFATQRQPGWAVYSAATGVAVLALFRLGGDEELMSLAFRGGVLLGWGWASVLAARVLTELGRPAKDPPRIRPDHTPVGGPVGRQHQEGPAGGGACPVAAISISEGRGRRATGT